MSLIFERIVTDGIADVSYLIGDDEEGTAATLGYDFGLLRAVVDVNRGRAAHFVTGIEKALNPLEGRVVAVLGLAFKPNTDDMREAKSIEVVSRLLARGAIVRAYDPVAEEQARKLISGVEFKPSADETAAGADAVVLVTEWSEFADLDWKAVAAKMARPLIVDGRNFLDAGSLRAAGFTYEGIGRAVETAPAPTVGD